MIGSLIRMAFSGSAPAGPQFVGVSTTKGSTAGTTVVVSKPAGLASGDLLLAFMCSDSTAGTAEAWSGDTGWTEVVDSAAAGATRIAYKVAGGSEPASYTFTGTASSIKTAFVLAFRAAAYDTVGSFAQSTGLPITATSVTASANLSVLLGFVMTRGQQVTAYASSSMTSIDQDNDANGSSGAVFAENVNSGATGTRTFTGTAGNTTRAVLLVIKPAP